MNFLLTNKTFLSTDRSTAAANVVVFKMPLDFFGREELILLHNLVIFAEHLPNECHNFFRQLT